MHFLFISAPDKPPATSGRDHALPKSLAMLGHDVTVIHPLLSTIDPSTRGFARRLTEVSVNNETLTLFDGRTARGIRSHYLSHPSFSPPLTDDANELFGRAAAAFVREHVSTADALVVEDQAGHEAARALIEQDVWNQRMIVHVDVAPERLSQPHQEALRKLREAGAFFSASSRAIAGAVKSSLKPEKNAAILRDGIDAAHWNPTTDPLISGRFDPVDLAGKQLCKRELQQLFELPVSEDLPFVAAIVASEEGLAALEGCADEILRNDCQLGVLLQGSDWSADTLSALPERWPDRVQVRQDEDAAIEHQLVAGADIFLVLDANDLSRTWHQIAQRYGAVPVVPDTELAREALVDCTADLKSGSAFLYDGTNPTSAARRALAGYAHMHAFAATQRRIMRIEHSWEHTARTLVALRAEGSVEPPAPAV